MHNAPTSGKCHARLGLAIASALVFTHGAMARTVGPGGPPVVLDNVQTPTETYDVVTGGELRVLNGSLIADTRVSAGTLVVSDSTLSGINALRAIDGAQVTITRGTLLSSGNNSIRPGLLLTAGSIGGMASVTLVDSLVSGNGLGANVSNDGILNASNTSITGVNAQANGVELYAGRVVLTDGSTVSGQANGVLFEADDRASTDNGRFLTVDGSTVSGASGSAIRVDQLVASTPTTATIALRNGAVLHGGNGVAIEVNEQSTADVTIDGSDIVGDLRTDSVGVLAVGVANNATLTGAANGNVAMSLASGTTWTLRDNSSIDSLDVSAGTVAFGTSDAAYHNLRLNGALSGGGGALVFNTALGAGGAIDAQQTDRLLIEGDVTTTTPTRVVVRGRGDGALTDTNKDGIVDANEGISLIQVGGTSRRDAFELAGGYVAAGPYQYKLYAFGPGEVDPAQKQLVGSGFNWDYRLGNSYVCEKDCEPVKPVDPENPGEPEDPGEPENPGNPGEPEIPGPGPSPGDRVEVVPQVPAYLSAPAALLTYGDMLNDGLHQRLGDIRNGESHDPVGGEMFARYLGGQLRYSSNLSFKQFGYDFDQQVNALQVGGSVIALDGDNGSLRAGWAVDHGTTRVTPKALDGESSSKYTANGLAAWITWQHGDGFWVDGVLTGTRYHGNVSTAMRGDEVADIRATGWVMSVEAGLPLAIGGDWTVEPQFQLKRQQLNFRRFQDSDGLDVALGTAGQTSARLGLQLGWSVNPAFAPYGRVDLIHTTGGAPGVDVSSEAFDVGARFASGRVGNAVRAAAGATAQLGRHVQVYGEGTWQTFTGTYGMRGWAGYAGLRVTF